MAFYYTRKKFIHFAEIWYDPSSPDKETNIDILRYKFIQEKRKKAFVNEKSYTTFIDLSRSQNDIFSNIKKNTRYEIKRALEKDNTLCTTFIDCNEYDDNKLNAYISFFNKFASTKKLSIINFDDLKHFINNKSFCVRYAIKMTKAAFSQCTHILL
jgi:hypothetical protein